MQDSQARPVLSIFFCNSQLEAFLRSSSQVFGGSAGSALCCQSILARLIILNLFMLLLTEARDTRLDLLRSDSSPRLSATDILLDILRFLLSPGSMDADICLERVFSLSTSLTSESFEILEMRREVLRSFDVAAGTVGTPKSVLP